MHRLHRFWARSARHHLSSGQEVTRGRCHPCRFCPVRCHEGHARVSAAQAANSWSWALPPRRSATWSRVAAGHLHDLASQRLASTYMHGNESAPRLPPATSTERHLVPESARHLSGSRRCGEIAVSSSAPGGPWGVGDAREGWVVLRKGPWTRYKSFVPTRRKNLNTPTWRLFCSVSSDAFRRTACTSPETVSRCVRHKEGVCRVSGASNEHSKRLDRS